MKQTLFEFFEGILRNYTKRFGIEVEVEGEGLPMGFKDDSIWRPVGDGSLRDGVEYLFRAPLDFEDAILALHELKEVLSEEGRVVDFSFRTSIHVHMNCLHLNHTQISNLIYSLVLLEPVLTNLSGDSRKHNRFCLTTCDAESQVDFLSEFINGCKAGEEFPAMVTELSEDKNKYSAVNIVPLRSKGTVEVRTMRGNINLTLLTYYLTLLNKTYDWAINQKSPITIYEKASYMGAKDFLEEILSGTPVGMYTYSGIEGDFAMQLSVNIGIPFGIV